MKRTNKIIVVVAVLIAGSMIATAALIPYFGQIKTTATVKSQAVQIGEEGSSIVWKSYNDPITHTIPDALPSETYCFKQWIRNSASVPVDVTFTNNDPTDDEVTTTYWKVDTAPTIDGVIDAGEWGESDFSGSDYDVYVLNDEEYLYVAFEAKGGDFTIASSMTNIYTYAGDDYAGECWAYCVNHAGDLELVHFTTHHIQAPKVKEGREVWPTTAIVAISTTVMEWKIPLTEFTMDIGDTIAFDFMSYSEGMSGWDTAWLYEQDCTIGTEILEGIPFPMQPGEQLPFNICHKFDLHVGEGTYYLTTTVDATETP